MAAKAAQKYGASVHAYDAKDYAEMRLFLTPDGKSGFALKGDDIVSAFKHPDTPGKGYVNSALALATKLGGRRLDAFDTVLPILYGDNGFKAVARLGWNEDYKPDEWQHETFAKFNGGKPDVVFMVYDPDTAQPYKPGDGVRVEDYDTGSAVQQASLKGIAERQTPAPTPLRMTNEQIKARIDAVAKDLDFDPAAIFISNGAHAFELNGRQYQAAGVAYIKNLDQAAPITIFANNVTPDSVDGLIAHEIEHIKLETALTRYSADFDKITAESLALNTSDPVMRPDGSLKPPYDAKYPAYQAMHAAFNNRPLSDFSTSDGVSDYSYDWWKAWRSNTDSVGKVISGHSAVHETLAEMARIKYDTGKFPDHMGERILDWRGPDTPKPSQATMDANAKVWRDLYRAVDKVWKLPS